MRVFCLCFLVSAALACLPANAQKLKIEPNQQYLLLATKQTSTMQEELSEAAKQGFRIVVGSPTSGTEMVLLLERVAQPPETYSYRLLATTRTGTMQKELNEAAREGFRLLPRTMIEKAGSGMFALGKDGPKEIVAVLERAPKPDRFYEYKLLATSLTSTLQQEIAQAVAAGFALAGLVSRGEHMVIMEKEAPAQ